MFPRNITRLTSNILKKNPYTFDVVWSKSNLMLIEMNPKYPGYKEKIPDYDMDAKQENDTHNEPKKPVPLINIIN